MFIKNIFIFHISFSKKISIKQRHKFELFSVLDVIKKKKFDFEGCKDRD